MNTTIATDSNGSTSITTATVNPSHTQYHIASEIDNHCAEQEHQKLIQSLLDRVKFNCDQTNNLQNITPVLSDNQKYKNTTNMPSNNLNIQNECNINRNDAVPDTKNSDKDYNEETEFQRASKV